MASGFAIPVIFMNWNEEMNENVSIIVQIAQLIGFVVSAVVFIVMIKADIKVLRVQMEGITNNIKILNSSFDKLGAILTNIAVQDQRISGLEEDFRELKHGRGFVDVHGEYTSKVVRESE